MILQGGLRTLLECMRLQESNKQVCRGCVACVDVFITDDPVNWCLRTLNGWRWTSH